MIKNYTKQIDETSKAENYIVEAKILEKGKQLQGKITTYNIKIQNGNPKARPIDSQAGNILTDVPIQQARGGEIFPELEAGDLVMVGFFNNDLNSPYIMFDQIVQSNTPISNSADADGSGSQINTNIDSESGEAIKVEHVDGKIKELLEAAVSKINCKYVYGSTGPDTFDCSGFAQWCYKQIGIDISRTTATQVNDGKEVSINDIEPGDLIIWSKDQSHGANAHVVIVYNDTQIINCGGRGSGVNIDDISYAIGRYKERPIHHARRIIE